MHASTPPPGRRPRAGGRRGLLLGAGVLALTAAVRAAPFPSQVLTADGASGLRPRELRQGPLAAVLQHERRLDADGLPILQPVVVVRLDGSVVGRLRGAVKTGSDQPMALLQLAELDPANPWPEVLLSSFSGGAHCCNLTTVLTSDASGRRWQSVTLGPFNGVVRAATDPLGGGRGLLVDADNRFLYQFASYAGSWAPPRIWQLSGGRFEDISHDPALRPLHRRALAALEPVLQEAGGTDVNGLLAGYVAIRALLGEAEAAWAVMLRRHDRRSAWGLRQCAEGLGGDGRCRGPEVVHASFPEALRAFLRRSGYLNGAALPGR